MSRKKALPPEGLWISPSGKRIPVIEHLITIQHHPMKFGLDFGDVEGLDIVQLREVADGLIRNGWIRFRHFGDSYNFEVESARGKIETVEEVLVNLEAYEGERVYISQASPRKDFVGTVADVFDRKIFGYQENPRKNRWRFS